MYVHVITQCQMLNITSESLFLEIVQLSNLGHNNLLTYTCL